jgi:hypothetical protein
MPAQFQNKKLAKSTHFWAKKLGIALALWTVTMFGNINCERHIDYCERYIDWSRSGRTPTAQRLSQCLAF